MALELKKVELVSCQFELTAKTETKYHLALSHFARKDRKGKTFCSKTDIVFDLFDDVDSKAKFTCGFYLEYGGDAEGAELLRDHIIVAHAVPYLREFVCNMTMRSPLPKLIIPPVNAINLLKCYTEKHK